MRIKFAFKSLAILRHFPNASVVVFTHDAHRHGAQLLSLHLIKDLKALYGNDSVVGIVLGGGDLVESFLEVDAAVIPIRFKSILKFVERLVSKKATLIFNSIATQAVSPYFIKSQRASIALIHELPFLIKQNNFSALTKNLNLNEHVVFPSKYVMDNYCKSFGVEELGKIRVIAQGLYQNKSVESKSNGNLKNELGIPKDNFLVANMAYGDLRKSPDTFAATAILYARAYPNDKVHFLWIGGIDPLLKPWIEADIDNSRPEPNISYLGFRDDVSNIYDSIDCFYLTSREDPFPSTVIEAYHSDKPIVLFDKGNGFAGINSDQFFFVEYNNLQKVIDQIHSIYSERPSFKHDKDLFYDSAAYAHKIVEMARK